MKRNVIAIDEEKCNGCGQCIPNCPEGAIQIIDSKARLISDIFCDGLGACIGHCPEGAIQTEKREARAYDEKKVIVNIVRQGANTLIAHLRHLLDHGETAYLNQALEYLRKNEIPIPDFRSAAAESGCPGSRPVSLHRKSRNTGPGPAGSAGPGPMGSELTQWPVQLTLLNPKAPYLKSANLLIAADCAPFAFPDFHGKFLKNRKLAIFCPKLDQDLKDYAGKLAEIFKTQSIKSVTVVRMEVPCCGGVTGVVRKALTQAGIKIPVREVVLSVQGEIDD